MSVFLVSVVLHRQYHRYFLELKRLAHQADHIELCFCKSGFFQQNILLQSRDYNRRIKWMRNMVQKDIARRKGKEVEEVTEKEKRTLEKVTGFAYEALWNAQNAGMKQ